MATSAAPLSGAPDIWIDVGGTFTDCVARGVGGTLATHKLLSSGVYRGRVARGSTAEAILDPIRRADPNGFFAGFVFRLGAAEDAPAETIVESFDCRAGRLRLSVPLHSVPEPGTPYELACDQPAPILGVRWLLGIGLNDPIGPVRVRLGTTRGTNALLERRGASVAYVATEGLEDLLFIGDQTRPRLFDLNIRKPTPLYACVIPVTERIAADGTVLTPLDESALRDRLLEAKRAGVQTLAIALLNSYRNPAHERLATAIAESLGFNIISLSAELAPLQGLLGRSETTVIDVSCPK